MVEINAAERMEPAIGKPSVYNRLGKMTAFDCIMLVKMSMTIETMLDVIKTKCQGNSFSLLNVVLMEPQSTTKS